MMRVTCRKMRTKLILQISRYFHTRVFLFLAVLTMTSCSKAPQPSAKNTATGSASANPNERIEGFTDTPMLPGGKWHQHDPNRPQPPVVTPGAISSQGATPPSDAEVLNKGMFDSYPQARDGAVDRLPKGIQGFSFGFFVRHQHVGSGRGITRKSRVRQQCAALRPTPTGLIGQLFVMHAAGKRRLILDLARVGDDQVLDAVPLLFSAVVALLSVWVWGRRTGRSTPSNTNSKLGHAASTCFKSAGRRAGNSIRRPKVFSKTGVSRWTHRLTSDWWKPNNSPMTSCNG